MSAPHDDALRAASSDAEDNSAPSAGESDSPKREAQPHDPPTPDDPPRQPEQSDAGDASASAPARPDPWRHRRAEPRALAFMWTLYLFAASMLTFLYVGSQGTLSWDSYRPAAKLMLITAAVGVGVLWPMVRLSQTPPSSRCASAMLGDWLVIVLPLAAVVLPQGWLAGWPMDVVLALAALLSAWAMLAAGVLTWGLCARCTRGTSAPRRAITMAVCLGLVLAWPGVAAAMDAAGAFRPAGAWDLGSPLTGVYALTADQPYLGRWTAVTTEQWLTILGIGLVGLTVWGLAAGRHGPRPSALLH